MTKRELIEQVILAKAELPRSEVEGLVNAVFDTLAGSMVRGERIEGPSRGARMKHDCRM